jgi:hypothetical protein
MKSITPDKLVSLILEEIQKTQAPDKPIFFNNFNDIERYFGFNTGEDLGGHAAEMGEMANIKKIPEKLPEPINISVDELSPESRNIPRIVSMDPTTKELVEGRIIGDEVITLPNGVKVLKFTNYGEGEKLDRSNKVAAYVVLPENIFYKHPPRNVKMGSQYVPKDLETEPENETPEDKEARLEKIKINNEAYAKRYVIYPAINNFFSKPEVLNRLDVSLIPETWAGPFRTERTTNVEKHFSFGGNGHSIHIEFYAVKDIDSIEGALDEIFQTRMDIEDGVENRQRKRSETKPREYANYIYKRGGNWEAIQRIYDEENFKKAGEYTDILKLLKQNIQKGQKGLNVMSKLIITGDLENGTEYVLKAKFTAILNYRTVEKGTGVKAGELINPVFAEVRRPIPPEVAGDESFSVRSNKNFFGKAGQNGIFVELMNKLGDEMMAKINPDDVLTKISELLVPMNVDKEFNAEM